MSQKFTYTKEEKLKSRKLIGKLFQSGSTVKSYPIRVHYLVDEEESDHYLKVGVSVSKRNFKRAVDRNRIKRQLREAYRLESSELKKLLEDSGMSICMMIIYIDRQFMDTKRIRTKTAKILDKIGQKLSSSK